MSRFYIAPLGVELSLLKPGHCLTTIFFILLSPPIFNVTFLTMVSVFGSIFHYRYLVLGQSDVDEVLDA